MSYRLLSTAVATLFAAGTAQAQPAYYVATPAGAVAKAQLMTRSTPWRLQDGVYVAGRAPERDLVLCQLVVKEAGPLQAFAVAGKAFDADTLAACNTKARKAG